MAAKQRTPLSQRLVASAKRAGLTTEQVAERLGVAASTVYSWRTGRNEPPLALVVDWAKLVGVSLAWLATGEEDANEEQVRLVDWQILTEEERQAIRVMVRGLAELRRREEAAAAGVRPSSG